MGIYDGGITPLEGLITGTIGLLSPPLLLSSDEHHVIRNSAVKNKISFFIDFE